MSVSFDTQCRRGKETAHVREVGGPNHDFRQGWRSVVRVVLPYESTSDPRTGSSFATPCGPREASTHGVAAPPWRHVDRRDGLRSGPRSAARPGEGLFAPSPARLRDVVARPIACEAQTGLVAGH